MEFSISSWNNPVGFLHKHFNLVYLKKTTIWRNPNRITSITEISQKRFQLITAFKTCTFGKKMYDELFRIKLICYTEIKILSKFLFFVTILDVKSKAQLEFPYFQWNQPPTLSLTFVAGISSLKTKVSQNTKYQVLMGNARRVRYISKKGMYNFIM